MIRTIRARYSNGKLEPLEPLALEEGEEIEVTLSEQVHESEEAEDAALRRAIEEGLTTERVDKQEVLDMLRNPDGG
ncbi:MAG: antitoxin family protein [Chloroflexi bacterium]|nr:antitoxin family protein [Chloroflexota bacterium]